MEDCKKCGFKHSKEEPCIDKEEVKHRNEIFSARLRIQLLQKRVGQFKGSLSEDFADVIDFDKFKVDEYKSGFMGGYSSPEDDNEYTDMLKGLLNEQQKLYTSMVNKVIDSMEVDISIQTSKLVDLKKEVK